MKKAVLRYAELYTGHDGFYRVVYADDSIGEGWATKEGALADAAENRYLIPLGIVRTRNSSGNVTLPADWRKVA